jgi:hypothetical protein
VTIVKLAVAGLLAEPRISSYSLGLGIGWKDSLNLAVSPYAPE